MRVERDYRRESVVMDNMFQLQVTFRDKRVVNHNYNTLPEAYAAYCKCSGQSTLIRSVRLVVVVAEHTNQNGDGSIRQ